MWQKYSIFGRDSENQKVIIILEHSYLSQELFNKLIQEISSELSKKLLRFQSDQIYEELCGEDKLLSEERFVEAFLGEMLLNKNLMKFEEIFVNTIERKFMQGARK